MKKRTLCLIFGGENTEYDVSLRSCACILRHINREKYDLYKIGITREGKWYLYLGDEEKIERGEWVKDSLKYSVGILVNEGAVVCENGLYIKPDVVFPIIHGKYGEDGIIKAFFDILKVKCVGCDTEGGALCVNKYLTKLMARENGVPVADFFVVRRKSADENYILSNAKRIDYPLFVKASSSGSSIGVYRVKNEKSLMTCIEKALKYSDTVLIEKEIKGVETEIALLETENGLVTGKIGQIEYDGEFYDYERKYSDIKTRLVIPAKISSECEKLIREYAKAIFIATGCRGMCRADFFVTEKGEVIFNEVNTVPGFTSGSMYPLLMTDENRKIGDIIDLLCL